MQLCGYSPSCKPPRNHVIWARMALFSGFGTGRVVARTAATFTLQAATTYREWAIPGKSHPWTNASLRGKKLLTNFQRHWSTNFPEKKAKGPLVPSSMVDIPNLLIDLCQGPLKNCNKPETQKMALSAMFNNSDQISEDWRGSEQF